jgi:DNA-binding Xre family transcriptional regulator
VIVWKLAELLRARGWTGYRLAQEAGISIPVAYRLAKITEVKRLDGDTLDRVCRALGVQPGELLAYTTEAPAVAKRRTRKP